MSSTIQFSDGPLVGRDLDLAAAEEVLLERRSLVLEGRTGVGRTRLWSTLIDVARGQGLKVVDVVTTRATATVPLAPFASFLPHREQGWSASLMQAVMDEMRARGSAQGLVIAVDDVHDLDAMSMALLTLGLGLPEVSLLLSRSTDCGVPDGLGAILGHDSTSRLTVEALEEQDATALAVRALGAAPAGLLRGLWCTTEGNPLLLRELVAGEAPPVPACDPEARRHGVLTSDRLVGLVRQRLAHLPEQLRESLEVLAVSSPVAYDLLEAAIGAEAFSALHDAGITETTVSEELSGEILVRHAHPLYGPVYAEQAGEARRRRAYRRLVDAADAVAGVVDPLRVARWHHLSGADPRPDLLLAGARSALTQHEGALGERLLAPVIGDVDQGHLLLGTALAQQGRFDEADAAYRAACTEAEDVEVVVEAVAARAFNLAFGLARSGEALRLLADAASEQPIGWVRGRLDAERGVVAALGGDFGLADEASRATIANPESNVASLASAYVSRTLAGAMRGQCGGFAELAASGVAAAAEAGAALPFACDQVLIMRAHAAMAAGALDDAVELCLTELEGPRASPLTATAWSDTLCIVRSMTGQLSAAAQDASHGRRAAEVIDPFGLCDQAVAMGALVQGLRGVGVAATDLDLLRARGAGPSDPRIDIWVSRALAWSRSVAGDRTAAVGEAAAGGRAGVEAQHITWGVMALHDAVRLGDAAGAREVVDDLQGAVRETEDAVLLETMARHAVATSAEDPEALGDVATAFARQDAWLLAAEAQAQRAALLARSAADNRVVSWASVLSQLWEAHCDGPCTPLLENRPQAGLTARQLEIARAAARGATSAEIAERHVLSVRTVDNHLGRVYRVLGLEGRDELASRFGSVPVGAVRGGRRG